MHKVKNPWFASMLLISVCFVGAFSTACQVREPSQSKEGKNLDKPSGVPGDPKDKNKENNPETETEKVGNEEKNPGKKLISSEETRLKEREVDSRELSRAQL